MKHWKNTLRTNMSTLIYLYKIVKHNKNVDSRASRCSFSMILSDLQEFIYRETI